MDIPLVSLTSRALPLENPVVLNHIKVMFTNCLTYDDLPAVMPLFPLHNTLLLPNGLLPLNIFEERYLKMVKDAMASDRFIGIVQPDIQARKNGNDDALMKTGCAGRIVQFNETDDGRYLITLKGVSRFEVERQVDSSTPYVQATISYETYADDIVEDCDTIEIDRDYFLPLLQNYLDKHELCCEWQQIKLAPCERLVTTLPMILPFSAQEKQMILESKTLDKRYEILSSLMEIALKSSSGSMDLRH